MLKVKDNVDLKELEKFGFVKGDIPNTLKYEVKQNGYVIAYINVAYACRSIFITSLADIYEEDNNFDNFEVLYDLIKADLIEKESDE